MGPFKFALKMLKLEYKKTFFYAFTLVVTVAVVFVFFNYAYNPYLGNTATQTTQAVTANVNSVNFSTALSMVMITLAILAACYSNSVYLNKKTNEIAIEGISGGSIVEIAEYLMAQNLAVGLIAIPVGLLLGFLLNPIVNKFLFNSLAVEGSLWYVDSEAMALTIVYIFTQIFAITLINTGFAYRNDILTLLNMDSSIKPLKPNTGIRMPVIIYFILYFIPFIIYFNGLPDVMNYIFYSLIGIYGIYGLYSRGLAWLLEKVQNKFNLSKPIALISVGNLKYSIVKTKSLVLMICFSIVALMGYCIKYISSPSDYSIIYISYIVCIILMTLMILYKIMLENDSHAHIFKSLYKLGYTSKQIRKIIKKEVFYYYALILFFISSYAVPILVHFVNIGTVSAIYAVKQFALYFVPIAFSGFIAYYNYKIAVFHKEG